MRRYLFAAISSLLIFNGLCEFAYGRVRSDSLAIVKGRVMHAKENLKGTVPLSGANVMLVNDLYGEKDTLYTITNADGDFSFVKLRPRSSFLSVSCVGFKTEAVWI